MWHKSISLVTLVVLGLLALPAVTQGQTNIAPNPSMEEDEVFQDDPAWTAWCTWNDAAAAGSTAKFDDTEFVDGTRSIRVDAKGGTDWYFIVANISMPAKVGTKYTLSFWAKAEAPRSIGVQWKAADNSVSWGFTQFDITTDWAEYYFTVPAQNADMKMEFFCAAVTTPFWIDFVWVYEGDYVAGILPSTGGAGSNKAVAPKPANGAVVETLVADLSWKAAKAAVSHKLYFGTDSEAVTGGTVEAIALTKTTIKTNAIPGYAALVPGQVYYWRVDEVNDVNPESPWQGDVWSFQVRPKTAWKPYPPDGMRNVGLDQDLSWDVGMGAMIHKFFLGDDADTVANMVDPTYQMTEPTYEPGTLEPDKTYYWRVDEFTMTAVVNKGPVWSFRTVAPGGGVQAEYFAGKELAGDPILSQVEESIDHDWAAEVAGGLSDNVSARWTANLEVPFAETYTLITSSDDGVRLWFDGRLVIDNWNDHGTMDNKVSLNLLPGQFYSIRMEWYEAEGGAVARLSWESPTLPRQIIPRGWLQLPLRAAGPHPVNGDPAALQTSLLTWIGGEGATEHVLYFGTDPAAVAADATPVARQNADETSYDPGPLQWGQTYYWRVDEVNPASAENPLKGAVWTFTAADFVFVEDAESYTADEGNRIYDIWLDGWTTDNGSTVGYVDEPYVEQRLVHSGYQSMPLDYNNVNAPFYSEIERGWDTAQDWTENGVNTLTLFVFGRAKNSVEPFYVSLTDKGNKSATVVHPDAQIVQVTGWTRWDIPLSEFAGVNPATIKKLCLGVGSRSNPVQGGTGLLLLDDLRVTKQ
jgi:hypothetical protein